MADIIAAVTSLVTAAIGWLGQAVTAVTTASNALLLFFILIPFCGIFAGLLRRFTR